MKGKESDEMALSTTNVSISKRERVIREASKKYEDNKNRESLIQVGGKLSANQEIDAVKIIKVLRGKE